MKIHTHTSLHRVLHQWCTWGLQLIMASRLHLLLVLIRMHARTSTVSNQVTYHHVQIVAVLMHVV